MFLRLLHALQAYRANPDPVARIANTVALTVASNQPFYPLYLHAVVGTSAWPAWITLITTPVFAAIPALSRRHSLLGRVMLPAIGVTNCILAVKLIGDDTGVELFLLPCALLGTLLFRSNERIAMVAAVAWPFVAYLFLDRAVGEPLRTYGHDEYRSIIAIHAFSVGCLMALIGLLFASLLPARAAKTESSS
jgi:hypothetical protein